MPSNALKHPLSRLFPSSIENPRLFVFASTPAASRSAHRVDGGFWRPQAEIRFPSLSRSELIHSLNSWLVLGHCPVNHDRRQPPSQPLHGVFHASAAWLLPHRGQTPYSPLCSWFMLSAVSRSRGWTYRPSLPGGYGPPPRCPSGASSAWVEDVEGQAGCNVVHAAE